MSRSESRHWTVGTITARLFFAVVALGIVLLPLSPLASSKAFAHAGAASSLPAASAPSGHVTVIALDMSGSMGGNDPNGLRCSAANAYVDLSGPGDFVGVVGLDNNGPTGGQHNFPLAQIWAQPVELATVAARQQLRATIAAKSHNCRPDAATPTYDALQQSLDMLVKTTAQTHLPGSVILLTDGVPAPQQNEQISAIQKDLIPQFKQHDFPIDTVALGADGTLRSFLSDLANATGGSYYDDGHGVVSGISPLNIAPFFVELFAQRNGRTVTHDIPPTALSGGTVSRNFAIGNFVSHLDVVAVKDSPGTRVTLTAPNGQVLPPAVAGTFISSDPHYVIFSVDHPQSGAWQLNVTGTGRFLMDSLKLSTLGLSILAPASDVPLPLGQPLTISATLNDNGTPITGSRYSMNGTINYTGGGTSGYTQEFVLDDHANPGTYSAQITVPASAPAGAYNVTINAREVSDTIASANRSVRIELFPSPLLVAPATGKPTTATVNTTVTQWDPALRALYGVPFGLVTWLSQWPLQGHPVVEGARLHGTVQLAGLPYANATVSGSATRAGTKAAIPLNISSGDGGRFTAAFTPSGDGPYTLTFRTQGSFKDSHGDLGTTTRAVALRTQPASLAQEAIAWMITLLYLFLLVLIVVLARYLLSQKPFGRLVANDGGGGEEFARARRGVYGLLHPGTVLSQQMGLDPGLAFRFQRGNRITVEGLGSGRKSYRLAGEPVPTSAVSAAESLLTTNEGLSYTVSASGSDEFLDEDEGTRRGGLLRRGTASDGYDDDDYSGGRRGLFGRTSRNDDFDEYDSRSSGRRSRRSRDDYDDDDDRASRSRRGSREDALDDDYSSGSRSRKSRRRDDDDY